MTLPPNRQRAVYEYRFPHGKTRPPVHSVMRGGFGPLGTIKEHHSEWNVTAEPSVMDRIIDWKIRGPNLRLHKEARMIRQFTIELRVNYADTEKNETMQSACAAAARHMFATANLLADGTQPDIAIYSDDWFTGKKEISLLQDVIAQGKEELGDSLPEGEVSSELMKAVRDGQ